MTLSRRTPGKEHHGSLLTSGASLMVLGAYGMGNIGDEAILGGLLARTRRPERTIVVSGAPAETSALHHVRAVSPRAAVRALRDVDALVIGGGGLFSRHMGIPGRLIPLFGLTALALGKRVSIEGVSIDRSLPPGTAPLLRRLARRAAYISVRDERSANILRSWGVAATLEPDFSVHLRPAPPGDAERALLAMGLDPARPIVGLCLTAVEDRFAEVLRAIPTVIHALPGVQFCFVPMSRHRAIDRHNDLVLAKEIKLRAPSLRIFRGVHHPAEVLAVFSKFSAAICMRYHSFLFADRMNVPVVGIPYAQKCESWMREQQLARTAPEASAIIDALRTAVEMTPVSCACREPAFIEVRS